MGLRNRFLSGRAYNRELRSRRLRMESLEPRLALTWAGVPPSSITPPTNDVALTLNSQGDATGTASIATTEVDYYSFTATSTGSYTISATTPSSNLDTVIGIFSATGQRLAYNDDLAGANTDSRITLNLTAGSSYFLGVTNYSSTSRGSYTYTIDGATPIVQTDDLYENNDTFGAAYNLGTLSTNRTISGLKLVDTADWYQFTTVSAGTTTSSVSISFTNSQGNLQLALFNSSGAQLSVSQGKGNSETISLNSRPAGTYYVRVYGNAGATNPNYTLTLTAPTDLPPPTTSGFTISLAMTGLTTGQEAIFNQAAARWSQIIIGDLPNATYQGQTVDDVLIAASAVPIDGINGILGQAAPDAFRAGSQLPYHGFMQFDTADMGSLEQSGQLLAVILHEMGHVLGIGTIWSRLGLLAGAGTADPTFIGPQATAAYNQIFATTATGVPVENSGGAGTQGAHWRESILQTELMTGFLNSGVPNPLSRITVASMADMGYSVNMAAADPYTRPFSTIVSGGQSSGGSSVPSMYSIIDTTQVGRPADTRLPSRSAATSLQPERRPAFDATATQFDREVVDAAVAATYQRADAEMSDDVIVSDDSDDAEFSLAWEDFESTRHHWSTFARL